MTAICIIPNCGRRTAASAPFCAAHRDRRIIAYIEGLKDKIEGLDSDLFEAVQVAYRRGAVDWARLNYPQWIDRLERSNDR